MRMSRVVIGGASIAAVVAAGSAYTAGNTLEANTVAGYGDETVTGATVTNTAYNPVATDPSLLDSVVFTATGDLTATTTEATMVLRDGSGAITSTITDCGAGVVNSGNTVFTCDLMTNFAFEDFTGVALTVVSQ